MPAKPHRRRAEVASVRQANHLGMSVQIGKAMASSRSSERIDGLSEVSARICRVFNTSSDSPSRKCHKLGRCKLASSESLCNASSTLRSVCVRIARSTVMRQIASMSKTDCSSQLAVKIGTLNPVQSSPYRAGIDAKAAQAIPHNICGPPCLASCCRCPTIVQFTCSNMNASFRRLLHQTTFSQ
jgi:hypothetical protein